MYIHVYNIMYDIYICVNMNIWELNIAYSDRAYVCVCMYMLYIGYMLYDICENTLYYLLRSIYMYVHVYKIR